MVPFFHGFWPFASYVGLIWSVVALCPMKTDKLDELLFALYGGDSWVWLVWLNLVPF